MGFTPGVVPRLADVPRRRDDGRCAGALRAPCRRVGTAGAARQRGGRTRRARRRGRPRALARDRSNLPERAMNDDRWKAALDSDVPGRRTAATMRGSGAATRSPSLLRELDFDYIALTPGRELPRPARQPRQPSRQHAARDAAVHPRGACRRARPWLGARHRPADGGGPAQQCRPDARDHGDLQRLVRPRADRDPRRAGADGRACSAGPGSTGSTPRADMGALVRGYTKWDNQPASVPAALEVDGQGLSDRDHGPAGAGLCRASTRRCRSSADRADRRAAGADALSGGSRPPIRRARPWPTSAKALRQPRSVRS